ncbi:hypothetical protein EIP86_011084 [Pleurotus ostreatoroseus]|nr:hypothetical protein EIP86_008879 [Pleurotus ostreatoroseus]KAF7799842.1 hypothetical protein EIP86_011084 [Pleurotus ostreatoroseus]
MRLNKNSISGLSLDAAGLVALADLSTIKQRTALTGSASYWDLLFLAPGIHTQQEAGNVNEGELPACGAMTTGYVFRVENQATVSYLQRIGRPGCLATVEVEERPMNSPFSIFSVGGYVPSLLYLIGISLTLVSLAILGAIHDFWAVGVLLMLLTSRAINTIVIKRRTQLGWKGMPEPGVKGDLMILLSQDRWVRMRGWVDDLKAVTSGQWLRDQTTMENFASAFATLLVYVSAALAPNASTIGSLFIGVLLLVSVALLGVCNSMTEDLQMFGRRVHVTVQPKQYKRRLDMAEEIIKEVGTKHWAIAMGIIKAPESAQPKVIL